MSNERRNEQAELLDKLRPAPILVDVVDAEGAQSIFEQQRREEDERRFPLLFDRYGVDEGDYKALAIALARAHVRGYQYRKPKAGNTRNLKAARQVVGWVEKMLQEGATDKEQAFERLIAHGGPYEDPEGDISAIKKRYQRSLDYLLDAGYNPDLKILTNECLAALEFELNPPDLSRLRDLFSESDRF